MQAQALAGPAAGLMESERFERVSFMCIFMRRVECFVKLDESTHPCGGSEAEGSFWP
jgi:hypothetical protein